MSDRIPEPDDYPSRALEPRTAGVVAHHAVRRASELACMVRDEGADAIGAFLDDLTPQALYGLVVALAAMVPIDESADDLLAWIDAVVLEAAA